MTQRSLTTTSVNKELEAQNVSPENVPQFTNKSWISIASTQAKCPHSSFSSIVRYVNVWIDANCLVSTKCLPLEKSLPFAKSLPSAESLPTTKKLALIKNAVDGEFSYIKCWHFQRRDPFKNFNDFIHGVKDFFC